MGNARDFEQSLVNAVDERYTALLDADEASVLEVVVVFNQLMAQAVNG